MSKQGTLHSGSGSVGQLLLQFAITDGAGSEIEYADRVTAALSTAGLQSSEADRIGQVFMEALRQALQREEGNGFPVSVRIWVKGLPAAGGLAESALEDQGVRRRSGVGWGFFLLERWEEEPETTVREPHRVVELHLYRERSLSRKRGTLKN